MKPAQLVNIIFTVSVPDSTQKGVPLRLAGNLLQLGNTFSDLQRRTEHGRRSDAGPDPTA